MARCYCHWRKVLICLCTPCICLALLFSYVSVMVSINMNSRATPENQVDSRHFMESEAINKNKFISAPKTFWELHPHRDAVWNQLQLVMDLYFSPILRPKKALNVLTGSIFRDSLLKQTFSKVTDLQHMRRIFDRLPQQMKEFARYMQKRDYPILLQPDGACGAHVNDEKEPPLLLFAIKTTELNFRNRQAIRQTWGQEGWVVGQKENSKEEVGGYVRRVFLLGKENTEGSVDVSELLEVENKRYGDILQWDFQDTFFNLTLKDVLFWSWFSSSCNQTGFVFKGDDDVFVNTPRIIAYLRDQLEKPQQHNAMKDFMIGEVIGSAMPSRANKSKYFIPDSFYKGLYPMYAGGGGVVYSGLLAKRLHHASKRVHLFPIDDVYVGMCMSRLNVLPIDHPAFLTFDFPRKEEEQPCSYHTIFLVHKRTPSQLFQLWTDMKHTQTQCRNVPLRVENKKKT